jgi:CheY-like chemotaxis protein
MGGRISVASEVDKGSVFDVSTRAPEQLEESYRPSGFSAVERAKLGPVPLAPRPLRVLVAEDDDTNAILTRALLKKLGHTFVRARNGAEAVSLSAAEAPDLILMDVQMPELDGFEATAKIGLGEKASGRHIPIVALTANAMSGDSERCLKAGMDAYLSKPISLDPLRDALTRWG